MLDQITEKLSDITQRLRGRAHITEANIDEILRDIRLALLEADVALPVVRDLITKVKTESLGQSVHKSLSPGQMFVGIFQQALEKTLMAGEGEEGEGWQLRASAPAVILMAGLQGVGKTTQTGKIALWLKKQKKKVLVVSCDAYRPAAIDQLKTLAGQIEVDFFAPPDSAKNSEGKLDPVKIAKLALTEAQNRLYDVLMVDTAGRLSIDEAMMAELQALANLLNPAETFLVIDAMQGQSALETAKVFAERVKITGLVMSKADGDSRGGAILSAKMVTGAPIRFTGISEKVDGLELFSAKRMAERILGMGDMVGLFESAMSNIDAEVVEKFAQKLKKGKGFDLIDFREQVVQMRKMGGMDSLLEKMPQHIRKMAQNVPQQLDDKTVGRLQGIIDSMTPKERQSPDLIKASRKKRIAAGSGTTVQEVNKLLSQFEQMAKLGKKFKGMGALANMMGGMGPGADRLKGLGGLSGMLGKMR